MDQVILISSDSSAPASPENYQDGYCQNVFKSLDTSPTKSPGMHKTQEYDTKMSQDSGLSLGVSSQPELIDRAGNSCLAGYDSDTMDTGYGANSLEDDDQRILSPAAPATVKEQGHCTDTYSENSGNDYFAKENTSDLFPQALNQLQMFIPSVKEIKDNEKKTKRRNNTDKAAQLEEKLKRQAEREKKKAEVALHKVMKQAAAASSRLKKPGECLKTIKVLVDSSLIQEKFGGALLSALEEIEVERSVQDQCVPSTITWLRQVVEHSVNEDSNTLEVTKSYKEEEYALLIWTWDIILSHMQSGIFIESVLSVMALLPGKKMTLLIFGPQKCSRDKKSLKKGGYYQDSFGLEDHLLDFLVELQLQHSCQYHFVHSPEEIGAVVGQFTKAIAMKPFKLEKQEEQQEETDWFATTDSTDCVKVDKNGNGMLQLWRQQLCQFPMASLATAEAIAAVYPSPRALLEAYKCCKNEKDGQLLLQDIKVRRAAGPLATVQRVGPELSKKIFKLFNADEGDEIL